MLSPKTGRQTNEKLCLGRAASLAWLGGMRPVHHLDLDRISKKIDERENKQRLLMMHWSIHIVRAS